MMSEVDLRSLHTRIHVHLHTHTHTHTRVRTQTITAYFPVARDCRIHPLQRPFSNLRFFGDFTLPKPSPFYTAIPEVQAKQSG